MNTLITLLPLASSPARAQGAGHMARIGASIWRWMESIGQARARRELLMLADQYDITQPELAKVLRAACARFG